jgi:hypothetical protein
MALLIGVLFLAGGIAAATMTRAPATFIALDRIVAYGPMAWLGGTLGSREECRQGWPVLEAVRAEYARPPLSDYFRVQVSTTRFRCSPHVANPSLIPESSSPPHGRSSTDRRGVLRIVRR